MRTRKRKKREIFARGTAEHRPKIRGASFFFSFSFFLEICQSIFFVLVLLTHPSTMMMGGEGTPKGPSIII